MRNGSKVLATAANEKGHYIGIVIITGRIVIIFRNPHGRLFNAYRERANSKWRQYVTSSLNRYYYVENLFRAAVHFKQSQSSISLSPFDSLKWILRDYTLHQVAPDTAHYCERRASLSALIRIVTFLSPFSSLSMICNANLEWEKIFFWKVTITFASGNLIKFKVFKGFASII